MRTVSRSFAVEVPVLVTWSHNSFTAQGANEVRELVCADDDRGDRGGGCVTRQQHLTTNTVGSQGGRIKELESWNSFE